MQALTVLLESAALVSVANSQGDTPLHLAAVGGHVECCRKLIEYDADTTATNT